MNHISILICTKDRADSLCGTLQSFTGISVPEGCTAELIVVDNGSADHTKEVVHQCQIPQLDSVYLVEEPQPGLNNARNTAVAQASGGVLLFTDDDVRVPSNWIAGMTRPILQGTADAVAGGVTLAPHLQRSWQKRNPALTSPLAATCDIAPYNPNRMVGANMAVAHHVFKELPPFDPNLDAGTSIGLGGDTLFSLQLQDAGFRLTSAFDVAVEHHCDPDRLSRESYLEYAEKVGRSEAYIDYHWRQRTASSMRLYAGLARRYGALITKRLTHYQDVREPEGIPPWEFRLLMNIYYRLQLLTEQMRRPHFQ